MEIKNRVISSSFEDWRTFEFLQADDFKELDNETADKIVTSIIRNNFTEIFYAWRNGEKIICIDGYQRIKKIFPRLERTGYKIPEKFVTAFIDCKDEKEAAELVLQYNSYYAKLNDISTGLHIEKFNLDFSSLFSFVNIPNIDLSDYFTKSSQEQVEIKEETIVPFKKTHVLISFPPDKLIDIRDLLEQLKNNPYVEYEQSSN